MCCGVAQDDLGVGKFAIIVQLCGGPWRHVTSLAHLLDGSDQLAAKHDESFQIYIRSIQRMPLIHFCDYQDLAPFTLRHLGLRTVTCTGSVESGLSLLSSL